MFDIDFKFEDIRVASICNKDISTLEQWLQVQNNKDGFSQDNINLKEIRERYFESLISESEFFLKVLLKDEIIGIVKGRIEFKNINEVWIWYFIIDKDLRKEHLGSKIIDNLSAYFDTELGKYNMYSLVSADNNESKSFWSCKGFQVIRVAKDYFDCDGDFVDMLIYKK